MQWKQSTALMLMAGALSGCSALDDQISGRYGPSPVLVTATVQASVAREQAVVGVVSGGVYGVARDPVTGEVLLPVLPRDGDRFGWYKVILMGFNTIDD